MNSKSQLLAKSVAMIAAALSACLVMSAPSQAKTSQGTQQQAAKVEPAPPAVDIGALIGVGLLNNSLGNQIVLGLDGGYKMTPSLRLGGYFTYNSLPNSPGLSASLYTFAPELTYAFSDLLAGFRVGAKAGLAIVSFSGGTSSPVAGAAAVNVSSNTSLSFVVGPQINYDYALGSGLTIGGEANLLVYTSNGGFTSFNILGALKYWL